VTPVDPPMRARRRRPGRLPAFDASVPDASVAAPEDEQRDASLETHVDSQGVRSAAAETSAAAKTAPQTDPVEPADVQPPPTTLPGPPGAVNRPDREDNGGRTSNRPPATQTATRPSRTGTLVDALPNPYAAARARHFNMRLLDPLRDRYAALVRELGDQGIETNVTELIHALLAEGPHDAPDARALLQRWRRTQADL
jgi:hypothetical protein